MIDKHPQKQGINSDFEADVPPCDRLHADCLQVAPNRSLPRNGRLIYSF